MRFLIMLLNGSLSKNIKFAQFFIKYKPKSCRKKWTCRETGFSNLMPQDNYKT